ncbi:MAG: tryptophan-rich sensory protein [Cytophagaceae bacterium]|nr:tryptophan-rich sensory protein [Gemmatimonadaceae bacterium]
MTSETTRALPDRGSTAPSPSALRSGLGLAGCIAVTAATGALGALGSREAVTLYAAFDKPTWAPPAGVFGPVWSVLYLSMAVAAWLVIRRQGWWAARRVLAVYAAQLIANALWSWFFFAWRDGRAAFIDVLILWVLVAATAFAFARVRRAAGLLLLPYLAWVSFASLLTLVVWRANPTLL